MKVLFLIAATVSCFGLALQPNTQNTQSVDAAVASTVDMEIEKPVMTVLLDTVLITPVAPSAVAANVR
ncbi:MULTISPECIES: hypothetical protein [Pontibacter]|uniref:Uncharacterized protein n=1 Tax=Pontibacter lucknowensis TaxID=1077936 RepID=A0A1N6Y4V7_9BACT|nr:MULTISPECIES: hypothetical protein [Pontibacter]EJF09539.1 hypothetical protein O71_14556 [Pontibacter sp. BAB1700]SIR09618.1 hypothetical protein SAMN05421545_2263 [Pontibacter lucknowensis]